MNVLQVISGILLVFSLLALLYWLSQRYGISGSRSKRRIQLVERMALGDKRSLYLVKVGAECFLLGSTPNGISKISEVEVETEEATERSVSEEAGSPAGFRAVLESLR